MKKNMGSVDRIVRLLFVALVVVLYFAGAISGTAAIILGVIAVVLLLTSTVGVCPLYYPLGLTTVKKKKEA